MKVKKFFILTVVFAVLAVMAIWAQPAMAVPAPEGDFTFNAGTGTITNYIGPGGNVEIPATIGGVPVTAIGYRSFLQKNTVTSVIIPVGVTTIDNGVFLNCAGLTSITIPESVATIGENAFQGCGNLTGITIPVGVTAINMYTFRDCFKLAEISLPNGLTSIGERAFWNCDSLLTITIPDTVTSIAQYAFQDCSKLQSITIPNGVTSISNDTFYSCSLLQSVTLPDGLASIGDWAFSFCGSLTSINIPNGVTSIGTGAFNNCNNLTGITLPNSVTSIAERMFSQCSRLASVTIPDSVLSIGNGAFFYCSSLASISIPDSVTSIGNEAFSGCSGLTGFTFPTGLNVINPSVFNGCSKLTSITIPASITSIGANAFQNCSGLTSLMIPNTVTDIGANAFQGCSSLTNLTIPDGITAVNPYTFSGCSNLTSLTIPSGITSIGSYAFQGCSSLTSFTVPDGITIINPYVFDGCSKLTSIIIPESVTSFDAGAFKGCSSLTGMIISDTVTSIGGGAFENCSKLQSIAIPAGITVIRNSTFYGCSQLRTVILPDGLTTIEGAAFYGCGSLNGIILPDSVTSIGGTAFIYCSSLTSITIPPLVTSIDMYTFRSSGLQSITLPNGLTTIGYGAFYGCSNMPGITIPDSVTSFGDAAFWSCSNLTSITIPENVTNIARDAFRYCSRLQKASFLGNAPAMGTNVFADTASGFKVYYYRDKTGFPGDTGGTWNGFNAFPLVSVTYDANDSSGGTVPVDGALYEQGQTVTVRDNTGSLTHTNAGYVFIGWNTAADGSGQRYAAGSTFAVAGGSDIVLYALWRPVYTVTWKSQDGNTTLETDNAAPHGYAPAFDLVNPVKTDTAQYDYEFIGWAESPGQTSGTLEAGLATVTGDTTYYAAFSETLRTYAVTWKTQDGNTTLEADSAVPYGAAPGFEASDPTKADTAQYDYEFAGWAASAGQTAGTLEAGLPPVSGSTVYYAAFSATLKTYAVTWMSQDGNTTLEADNAAPYGSAPAFDAADPTKADTARYDYEFAGWAESPDLTAGTLEAGLPAVSGSAAYYAAFSETERSYTVTFNSNAGSAVSSQSVVYNNSAAEPAEPTKAGHTFAGWYADSGLTSAYSFPAAITEDIVLFARWTVNTYTVTWKSQDGNTTLEADENVPYGSVPGFDDSDPVKADTVQYDYEFAGWATSAGQTAGTLEAGLPSVSGSTTYYAAFSATLRTYAVTWMSQDGNTTLEADGAAPYGSNPGFDLANPTKADTAQYDYEFVGWAESPGQTSGTLEAGLAPVTGDTTYYAAFSETLRTYAVTWKTQDGNTTLEADSAVPYGAAPGFDTADPTKADTAQYDYNFAGWAASADETSGTQVGSLPAVTGNVTYYAAFSETLRTYTVTWKSQDGNTTYETDTAAVYGSALAFDAADPTKADTAQFDYNFIGWATGTNQVSGTIEASLPAVSGNTAYYAAFSETVRSYTVTFNSNGGSAVSSQTIDYNNTAAEPAEPTKTGHTFAGWYTDSGLTTARSFSAAITDSITLYAKWTANIYTVTWMSQYGNVTYETRLAAYGTAPSYDGADPAKAGNAQYEYAFDGWAASPGQTIGTLETSLPTVSGNTIYYAAFDEILRRYTVTFESGEGSAVSSQSVGYNNTAAEPTEPTKVGHTFAGWYADSGLTSPYSFSAAITANITLYAKWTVNTYTVTWMSQDGNTILEVDDNVPYGARLMFDADDPAKDDAVQYYYVFAGWASSTGQTIGATEDSLVVTANITYYAAIREILKTFSVIFEYNNGDSKGHSSKNVPYGSLIRPPRINPERTGYTFSGWYKEPECVTRWDFLTDTVVGRTILYAKWTVNPPAAQTETYNADVQAGDGTETTLPVTTNKEAGTASIDISAHNLTLGGTVITIPPISDISSYAVGIPVSNLSAGDGQKTLTLHTQAGSIAVASNMLTGAAGISGSMAEISIGRGEKDKLPDDVKAAVGSKPLISLSLSVDGKQASWNNPNAPVTVSIPYTPTAEELNNPESIVIWYIDGSGTVNVIPNGHYNPATGCVTFDTTHFSDYAVAFNNICFNDVTDGAWYGQAVRFIAARAVTTGTGGDKYSPGAKLTRGDFIVLLMRAYGIAPDPNTADNFKDAGITYYTGYLAAAKRLGISAGIGGSLFAPDREITRQEMFTLLYNALSVIGQLPQAEKPYEDGAGRKLSDFTDAGQVETWAKDALALFVGTGVIEGSGGRLNPTGTATRAEMAQLLYKLLLKQA